MEKGNKKNAGGKKSKVKVFTKKKKTSTPESVIIEKLKSQYETVSFVPFIYFLFIVKYELFLG